jgi:hypothetical protein
MDHMVGEMPKTSIGNYKGVMLCNRPDEFGRQRATETGANGGPKEALRVLNPTGWNPCQKLFPRKRNRNNVFNEVLSKHKIFLKSLELDRL